MKTKITELFGIEYPIVQGGMIWAAGHELAAAVSEAGGLGLLGSGSMYPEELREEIEKTRHLTSKSFGVNVPLLHPGVEEIIAVVREENVRIIFTSAGNPWRFTEILRQDGIKVAHVVPSVKFALKAQAAGVDAIVAEGTEAGGHNGFEEITTFCLIPQVVDAVSVPVIAAGGVADGRGLMAALALGAEGVQVGTRFALTKESAAHPNYKKVGLGAGEADTLLFGRKVGPIRAFKNEYARGIYEAEFAGAPPEKIRELIGEKRAKLGIREGDVKEGDLEMGQIAALIEDLPSAAEVVQEMMADAAQILGRVNELSSV